MSRISDSSRDALAGAASCAAVIAGSQVASPYALELNLAGVRLSVRSNSPSLIESLSRYYREFAADGGEPDLLVHAVDGPSPAVALPFVPHGPAGAAKEEYVDLPDGRVVRKRRTGLWLVFGRAGNYILGPCAERPQQVANCINARFVDRELARGARLIHAAGVALGERGLALAGFAGAGKSTLALELMRQGADFVTNDRGLVSREAGGLFLTGVVRPPRVNPGTILANDCLHGLLADGEQQAYAALAPGDLWALERKYDVPIAACFGHGRVRLRVRLAGLVILAWKPGGGAMRAQWTDLSRREEYLPAVTKDLGVLFAGGPRPAELDGYRDLLGRCPVLAIAGGVDFTGAAALCLDVLGRNA